MIDPLTPARFDTVLAPDRPARIIWTLGAIARRLGVSVDFVRNTVSKLPGTPVHRMGSRWYALEDDLMSFVRKGVD